MDCGCRPLVLPCNPGCDLGLALYSYVLKLSHATSAEHMIYGLQLMATYDLDPHQPSINLPPIDPTSKFGLELGSIAGAQIEFLFDLVFLELPAEIRFDGCEFPFDDRCIFAGFEYPLDLVLLDLISL